MKVHIPALIVVEGVSDVQFLQTFIDAEFAITNGSAILTSTIDYIRSTLKHGKEVIILTDPDFPGEKIRTSLTEQFPSISHAFVDKKFATSKGKVGVAESQKDRILEALALKVTPKRNQTNFLKTSDLHRLNLIGGIDSLQLRMKICDIFHIGHCNAKTFLKRLNFLNVTVKDIEKALQTL